MGMSDEVIFKQWGLNGTYLTMIFQEWNISGYFDRTDKWWLVDDLFSGLTWNWNI